MTLRNRLLMSACLVALWSGCFRPPEPPIAPGMVIASGTVSLDGAPLGWGSILFRNQDPAVDPGDANFPAAISRGKFKIEIAPGAYRVEISQERREPSQQESEGTPGPSTQVLPKKFNVESKLTATVAADGPNQFAFSLISTDKE